MRVRVRLFASYREAAGTGLLELDLPAQSRVLDVLTVLEQRFPSLSASQGLVALNQDYVARDAVIQAGDEVALIPPVSGGSQVGTLPSRTT